MKCGVTYIKYSDFIVKTLLIFLLLLSSLKILTKRNYKENEIQWQIIYIYFVMTFAVCIKHILGIKNFVTYTFHSFSSHKVSI